MRRPPIRILDLADTMLPAQVRGHHPETVLDAHLAGGHNFLLFDAQGNADNGNGYKFEAIPTTRPVTKLNDAAIAHTNHTLSDESCAVVMRPTTNEFWAAWGMPKSDDFEKIYFP